jgi:pilus assembly protein CpaD
MLRVNQTVFPVAGPAMYRAMANLARAILAINLLAAAAMVAGCAELERDNNIVGSIPDDYRTRHPIVVNQAETAEDIIVSVNAQKLTHRDKLVAEAFADRFSRSGARSMGILIPKGSVNDTAARRIAYEIVGVLRDKGVNDNRIHIQHYNAQGYGDAAPVRLAFSDIVANVASQCGQWQEDALEDQQNNNYANFGCATQRNLAAIVADPADLIGPRAETEIDATRRTNVIEDWRENGSERAPILF